MRYRGTVLWPVAALLALVLNGDDPAAVVSGRDATQLKTSEVIVVGALHTLGFLHPDHSPAHIRALLSKIDPAAVCIELQPDWESAGGIPTFPSEIYATITWAQKRGVPVYGVDWYPEDFLRPLPPAVMDQPERLAQYNPDALPPDNYAGPRFQAQQAFGDPRNHIETYQRQHPETVTSWPTQDEGQRDDIIAARVKALLAKHPNGPVAVVYGSAHYLALKRRLEPQQIPVRPAGRYFPLTPQQIEAAWHPDDAVMLLGTNLDDARAIDAPQTRNHQRTLDILARMKRDRPSSTITKYFDARWRMFLYDFEGAKTLLSEVAQSTERTELPYLPDTRWSWPPFRSFQQKARFYLAVAHDLTGDRPRAIQEYKALLALPQDQLVVPALPAPLGIRHVDLRPFLRSFLDRRYGSAGFEKYRARLAAGR